jgi:hypothetical protein
MIYGIRRKGTDEAVLFPLSKRSSQRIEGSYDKEWVERYCTYLTDRDGCQHEVFVVARYEDTPFPEGH